MGSSTVMELVLARNFELKIDRFSAGQAGVKGRTVVLLPNEMVAALVKELGAKRNISINKDGENF
ncbi:hypothetical protein HYFRA_00003314 [Hymenoscyphus fraxineus]|uniref:Uncharacterized protein n=1 Tax=Hymenoscyphus fraxineus TaxID=746836 RepID=A0A9N9KW84_9HELO|nr:hypothetical protein HYFRA_00003314 [Hymenoscyphus fraxineus]